MEEAGGSGGAKPPQQEQLRIYPRKIFGGAKGVRKGPAGVPQGWRRGGAAEPILEASGGVLEASGRRLEGILGGQDDVFGTSWGHLGSIPQGWRSGARLGGRLEGIF